MKITKIKEKLFAIERQWHQVDTHCYNSFEFSYRKVHFIIHIHNLHKKVN